MAYQCVCRNALGNADAVVRLYRKFIHIGFFATLNTAKLGVIHLLEIHPAVSDEGEMNEVYQDSDQQDGRGECQYKEFIERVYKAITIFIFACTYCKQLQRNRITKSRLATGDPQPTANYIQSKPRQLLAGQRRRGNLATL